jgi:hypothetical protein
LFEPLHPATIADIAEMESARIAKRRNVKDILE